MAKRPRLIETTDLCPRCAMAEAVVEDTGFCEACSFGDLTEKYQQRQAALHCQTFYVLTPHNSCL